MIPIKTEIILNSVVLATADFALPITKQIEIGGVLYYVDNSRLIFDQNKIIIFVSKAN